MTRWQDKVLREGNSFEQDVDTMLKELGYTPIKIYQRKGMPVNDPNGKITFTNAFAFAVGCGFEDVTLVLGKNRHGQVS